MKKISSGNMVFMRKVFPALWFGILLLFIVEALASGAWAQQPMILVGPCVMAVFGFFLMRKIVWDLVDEVYDCGDSLLVRGFGKEAQVPLSSIINVGATTHMNPPRITLRLASPGPFGNEIAFSPRAPFTLNPFARNAVAEDLIVRVDRARADRVMTSG